MSFEKVLDEAEDFKFKKSNTLEQPSDFWGSQLYIKKYRRAPALFWRELRNRSVGPITSVRYSQGSLYLNLDGRLFLHDQHVVNHLVSNLKSQPHFVNNRAEASSNSVNASLNGFYFEMGSYLTSDLPAFAVISRKSHMPICTVVTLFLSLLHSQAMDCTIYTLHPWVRWHRG